MRIISREYNPTTKETHYKVKSHAGTLVLRADANKVPEKEIMRIARIMNEEKIKDMPIVQAFDLPMWTSKLHPRLFQLYMIVCKLKVIHKRNAVEFWKKGKKVARLKMINGFQRGKFTKYN